MGRLVLGERVRLYGREPERAAVDELLDAARRSRGGALVLQAEPGGGKSALLGYALDRAPDMRVLRAVGVEPEADLPFAALHQLLRPVLPLVDRLPEVQSTALRGALGIGRGDALNRFVVSLSVLTLLAEVAADEPVLCLVDDAHWLDPPSADALAFVARRLEAERVLVLFGARTGDVRGFPARDLPHREVPGLDPAPAERLLVDRFGSGIAPEVRPVILRAARGNPLALLEIPEELTADQLSGRAPLPRPMPMGRDLEEMFRERVRRLPPDAGMLLLVTAAEGSGDARVVLSACSRLRVTPAALAECEAAGLLRAEHGALVFRHPILRAAIYRTAPLAQRQAVHQALVAVLQDGVDADRRAWHRAALMLEPDQEIADELERTAGRAMNRSGHVAASAALRRAAELTPTGPRRSRRLVAAARAAWEGGRADDAAALLGTLGETGEPAVLAEQRHLEGEIALDSGSPHHGAVVLMDGARAIDRLDPAKSLEMLFDAAFCANYAGDVRLMTEAGRRASELPIAESDPAVPFADLLAGVVEAMQSPGTGSRERLGRALATVAEADEPRWLLWAGAAAAVLGDQARNAELCRRAEAIARRSTAVGTLPRVLERVVWTHLIHGRVAAVSMLADEGLRLALETGLTNPACFHRAALAWVAAVRGEQESTVAHAELATAVAERNGLAPHRSMTAWAGGLLHLGLGDWDGAVTRLEDLLASDLSSPYVARQALPDLVEAGVRADRHDLADTAAIQFDRFARAGPSVSELALAARCRALTSRSAEEREELYAKALALDSRDPRPFGRGRTLLLLGEHLRRDRRRAEARPHLREAAEIFQRLGAAPWEKRARAELRATGESTRKREPVTLLQLTPQQIQIAQLVAEGATNKEVAAQLFLSPRTVDYHLRKVFIKLDIASRAELIRHGLADV